MTSASPSVPTVSPRAPASSCIRAMRTLLCVLTWGRSAIPRAVEVGLEPLDVRHDALDEHHQRRRVEAAGEGGQGRG